MPEEAKADPVIETPPVVSPEEEPAARRAEFIERMNRFKPVTAEAPVVVPSEHGKNGDTVPDKPPASATVTAVSVDDTDPVLGALLNPPKPAPVSEVKTDGEIDFNKPEFKTSPKALRTAYEALKTNYQQLEQRVKEFEKSPKGTEERAALAAKVEELQRERDELNAKVEKTSFRESPAFKKNFIDPWQEVQNKLAAFASEFERKDGDKAVPVSWEDVTTMFNMTRPRAREYAKELFGEDAAQAMVYRDQWLEGKQKADDALAKHRELQTKEQESQKVQTIQARSIFDEEFSRRAKDGSSLFGVGDDKDLQKAWQDGEKLVEAALWGNESLSPEQRIKIGAAVKVRAMAMPVVAMKLQKAEAELVQVRAELAKIKGSGPGTGGQPGGVSNGELTSAQRMDAWRAKQRGQ